MKGYTGILKNCPLFQGIPEEELPFLLACLDVKIQNFPKEQNIFREGDAPRSVGILLRGEARIWQSDYYGKRSIVAQVTEGELFGEAFACAGLEALPVSVTAARDSEVLLLDCQRIVSPCGKGCTFHQQLLRNLLAVLADKNVRFHEKIQVLGKRTTREKLLAYLAQQARQQGSRQFTIPFDRQELADYLGVDRSGLSMEISRLKAEGVLSGSRSTFTLL